MRIEKKENDIIEIHEKVKIKRGDHDLVLEPGDKIEALSESEYNGMNKNVDILKVTREEFITIMKDNNMEKADCRT